ncbi:MAG: Txe/YoeB family addiction module toxin [Acaryochloris sp. RU_4_1]|nr:Txe/YoeB family addiction module toxin [Acaryochloris sp. RU_4_1]NJR54658.1 Txe/YoeB family addiction module toxin [Acaryochloris sp. CRU_2_0]
MFFTKQAVKDAKKIAAAGLKQKVERLVEVLQDNPYTPPYEKLVGDMQGFYSRRINIQHRLVYQILEEQQTIKILRLWSHYE